MSAILDRGDLRAGNKIAIAFALAGPGPILISTDQKRRDINILIDVGCGLPTSGVTQEAYEGLVMTAAVTNQVHLFEQLRRYALRMCHASTQNRLHNDEIPKPHNCSSNHRGLGRHGYKPSEERASRQALRAERALLLFHQSGVMAALPKPKREKSSRSS